MKFGLCDLATIPVRQAPGHRAEMVSQLVFGELFRVLETRPEGAPEWIHVECVHDGYVGWIPANQYHGIDEREFEKRLALAPVILAEPFQWIENEGKRRMIPAGSQLSGWLANGHSLEGQVLREPSPFTEANLLHFTSMYLHAPYLWGGRTPSGIDCSGFAQMTFRYFGKALKRDAYLQADQGAAIESLAHARPGDLTFFEEPGQQTRKITHVGILLADGKVIHAAGRVKICAIDETGILNPDAKSAQRYTHLLQRIRRV